MGSRIQSHKLSNGLLVSGRGPELPKHRPPTLAARAVPYTGGDVKKSGELGKMFDIPLGDGPPPLKHSRPSSSSQKNSGSLRSRSNSGQVSKPNSRDGLPMNRLGRSARPVKLGGGYPRG